MDKYIVVVFTVAIVFMVCAAQQCNDNEFFVGKDGQTYFAVSANKSCFCDSFIGNGSGLTGLDNQPTIRQLEETLFLQQQQIANLTSQITSLNNRPSLAATISIIGQSMDSNSSTLLMYDTIEYNTTASYNTTSGIFTAPVSGKYLIHAYVSVQAIDDAVLKLAQIIVYKSGTTYKRLFRDHFTDPTGFNSLIIGGTCVVNLEESQWISFSLYVETVPGDGTWRISGDPTESYLMINKL